MNKTISNIFKKGSRTYFYTTIFFPKEIKVDVFTLYSFVRKLDDYVDCVPQKKDEFYSFIDKYESAIHGTVTGDVIIDSFVELVKRKSFNLEWINAFFSSMESDLFISKYNSIKDLKKYLYGSAEVVGLMMAKILNLETSSYEAARYLGRAMQYVNFVRDITEDLDLGRQYLPTEDLEIFNLKNLLPEHTRKHPNEFRGFIQHSIRRYFRWQEKAERGFDYIPDNCIGPIKTASDMYKWTAAQIMSEPLSIYQRKIKPSVYKIVGAYLVNNYIFSRYKTPSKRLAQIEIRESAVN